LEKESIKKRKKPKMGSNDALNECKKALPIYFGRAFPLY
jgi:hypothetical protein